MNLNQFISKLKDPDFLLRGCQIFWDNYEDNVSFAVQSLWQNFLKGGQRPDKPAILGGAEAILLKWNRVFYESRPSLVAIIEDELEDAYASTLTQLEQLYNLQLGQSTLGNYLRNIKAIYENYKQKSSIRITGASKVLHFIHPKLFVAWDDDIRKYYHENDPSHSKQHHIGDAECYAEFIKTCNDIATSLLKKKKLTELVERHPAFLEYKQIRTLPKMLDECNWCWIKKEKGWF